MSENGKCINCNGQMQWTGKLWIHCEHCGQLQVWPVAGEKERDEIVLRKNRRKEGGENVINMC